MVHKWTSRVSETAKILDHINPLACPYNNRIFPAHFVCRDRYLFSCRIEMFYYLKWAIVYVDRVWIVWLVDDRPYLLVIQLRCNVDGLHMERRVANGLRQV